MPLPDDLTQDAHIAKPKPSSWTGLVVFCAGTAWDTGWYPEKHISTRIASRFPVLYVDPPTTLTRLLRDGNRRPTGLRIVKPGLAVLSSVTVPGASRGAIRRVSRYLFAASIRRALASLGQSRARALVVANGENLFRVIPADRLILYATDNFVSGAKLFGVSADYLRAQEVAQARDAQQVVVVTEELRSHWARLCHDPILIPNGCDTDRFRNVDAEDWPEDVKLPRPIAGVFGHLSERIDLSLLEATADRHVSLLLVGSRKPSFSLDSLTSRPNVRYLGPKPFESMNRYLKAIDVGLTPYTQSEFNRSSFPMKTIEYLAAGRPAIATSLPAVKWLNCEYIIAKDLAEDFAQATESLLMRGRSQEIASGCRAFAEKHSWNVRAEEFAALLG